MSPQRPDSELVAATLGGERSAFEELLDRHVDRVRLLAGRMLRPEDAEDVVQEALLQAFLGLERLRDPERFGSWLYGITLNLARMRLRRRDPLFLEVNLLEQPTTDGETALEAVRDALDVLPPREREAVVLHYVEGLDTQEVASLLGTRPGTVRVRLHRARRRLRRDLAELAPSTDKEAEMIEVGVEDVVVRMSGENGDPSGVIGDARIVLLKEVDGERRLPIWIGSPEGAALALQLGGEAMPRPMTPDLLAKIIEAAGATVERVAVNTLLEETFYATIVLATGSGTKEVDARPSDALNLALRVSAPIYVSADLMEKSAFTGDVDTSLKKEEGRFGVESSPPGDWRSLTPELVKSMLPPPKSK
ncbi:MAG: bifunctional nuclease domain-containing protein [Gaiellaceae bacterium]